MLITIAFSVYNKLSVPLHFGCAVPARYVINIVIDFRDILRNFLGHRTPPDEFTSKLDEILLKVSERIANARAVTFIAVIFSSRFSSGLNLSFSLY